MKNHGAIVGDGGRKPGRGERAERQRRGPEERGGLEVPVRLLGPLSHRRAGWGVLRQGTFIFLQSWGPDV